uniref:Uncharacterized protein n=1 Tax=Anopheles albimanus TaxID=7167 RepID=A0A182FMP2_ANOAL
WLSCDHRRYPPFVKLRIGAWNDNVAIRRFNASRGWPTEFASDRGANYIGAARELSTAFNRLTVHVARTVNSPGGSHFGEYWERRVRSAKKAPDRMELPRAPREEVLLTTLKEAEMIINSRPLTYLPLEDEDGIPITPNHILFGSSNGDKLPIRLDESATAAAASCTLRYATALRYASQLWKHWWFDPAVSLTVGNIVIVIDTYDIVNNLPRDEWPKDRVVEAEQSTL